MPGDFIPPVVAKLTGDDRDFIASVDRSIAKADQFKEHIDKVGRTKASATVALDDVEAKLRLSRFEDRLDAMRAKVTTARVDADTAEGRRKLDAFDIQLRRLGMATAKPNIDLQGVARAELALEALQLRMDTLGGGSAGGGRGGAGRAGSGAAGLAGGFGAGWLGLGIGAAIPAAFPLAGAALGAGGGLLSAAGVGGLGLGAFGLGAKSSVQTVAADAEKLTKLQERYNAAVTDKQRVAILHQEAVLWESMNPQQRAAVKNVNALKAEWVDYQKQLQPQTFHVLADGASLLGVILHGLLPTGQAVGDTIDRLTVSAEKAFKDPFWQQWFRFIGTEAPYYVEGLGTALGHLGEGVARLVQDFNPLGHDVTDWLDKMAGRFDQWAAGSGPQRFVDWVEQHGPGAASAISALVHALTGLAGPFTAIGEIELSALTPVLNWIGDMSHQHPEQVKDIGLALLVVAGGIKAINAAGSIATVLGALRGGLGGAGALTGGGLLGKAVSRLEPVPVFVTNWGGGLPLGGGGAAGTEKVGAEALGIEKATKGPLTRVVEKLAPNLAAKFATSLAVADPASWALLTSGDSARVSVDQQTAMLQALLSNVSTGTDPALMYRFYTKNMVKGDGTKLDGISPYALPPGTYHQGSTTGDAGNPSYLKPQAAAQYILQRGNKTQIADLMEIAKLYPQIGKAVAAAQAHLDRYNDSIDAERSALARLRAAEALHAAAVADTIANLKKIPGALAQAEAQAKAGGMSIGKALDDGITFSIKQGAGQVDLVSEQLIGGVLQTISKKAQIASPSKATKYVGAMMIAGLIQALEEGKLGVYGAGVNAMAAALAGFTWQTGKNTLKNHGLSAADQAALTSMGLGSLAGTSYTTGHGRKTHHLTAAQEAKALRQLEEKATSTALTHLLAGERSEEKAFTAHGKAGNLTAMGHDVSAAAQALRVAHVLARATVGLPDHTRALTELARAQKDFTAQQKVYLARLRLSHAHEAASTALLDSGAHSGGYLARMGMAQVVHVHGSVWEARRLHRTLGTVARQFERNNTTNGMTRVRKIGQ